MCIDLPHHLPRASEEPSPPPRRSYDSPVRRRQMAQTRTRILAAGAALARQSTSWDWPELTCRAVALRAGVSERTVFRHFGTERDLRRAVMRQLEIEAGVEYEALELGELGLMARRVFVAMGRFAIASSPMRGADRRRHPDRGGRPPPSRPPGRRSPARPSAGPRSSSEWLPVCSMCFGTYRPTSGW